MNTTKSLVSGQTYNFAALFAQGITIAVPDLQRDYCWGLNTHDKDGHGQGELVSGFLRSLRERQQERGTDGAASTLGLIYGYEWPKGTCQLCDGQQRLTTFYLLAGELHRRVRKPKVRQMLRDILTQDADNTPALQYTIRESTLYFLADLLAGYFLNTAATLPFVPKSDRIALRLTGRPAWYFAEYDNDPTIQAMLAALRTIGDFLDKLPDVDDFAQDVATNFQFIYYDMGDRLHGEKTFVVLNTTGEPLTTTENLKPVALGSLTDTDRRHTAAQQWEKREDWFWQNRHAEELTSDKCSEDFYTWWVMARDHAATPPDNLVKAYAGLDATELNDIHGFWEALRAVCQWLCAPGSARDIVEALACAFGDEARVELRDTPALLSWLRRDTRLDLVLPLTCAHRRWGTEHRDDFLRRLAKDHYHHANDNDKAWHARLRALLRLIDEAATPQSALDAPAWLDDDERKKREVFATDSDALVRIELHPCLRLDLSVLWHAGAATVREAEAMADRLTLLHTLANGGDPQEHRTLSNLYRTLRALKGWGAPAGHQWQTNWSRWGIWFNYDGYAYRHTAYTDAAFLRIIASDRLTQTIREALQNELREHPPFFATGSGEPCATPGDEQAAALMRGWVVAKMLLCEERGKTMSTYGDYSLGFSRSSLEDNVTNTAEPATIGNLCPQFAHRLGWWRVSAENFRKTSLLDSPLFGDDPEARYADLESSHTPAAVIDRATAHVRACYDQFML